MATDTNLEEMLDQWEAACENGQVLSAEELCVECPELLLTLKKKIAALVEMDQRLTETIPLPQNQVAPQPKELSDYEILETLGGGGMGTVYRARQHGTDQIVALKMVRHDWISRMSNDRRREAIDQFHVEVKSAARLKHPSIVKVFHMGETDGQPYFAMELVDGKSLSDALKQGGALGNRRAAKYIADVAAAIHEAHRHGILHRDLKPQNILLDESHDTAKVADFGLAELRTDIRDVNTSDNSDPYRIAGTLLYMAPELLTSASEATVSSDIYSLGATLYQLLTGRPPVEANSLVEMRQRIETSEIVAPSRLNPNVSGALDRICLRCLAKNPDDRFVSADELSKALQNYLDDPKFATQMATMSRWMFGFAFVVVLLNFGVFLSLRYYFIEPLVWGLIFCMYPPLFVLFANIPERKERDNRLARSELWSIWLGKMFAAACICVGLRITFHDDPQRAVELSYPMFAGLSGMAAFSMGASFWRGFYICSIGFWIIGVLMMLNLAWAPIEYALYTFCGIVVFGFYLKHLGREFR